MSYLKYKVPQWHFGWSLGTYFPVFTYTSFCLFSSILDHPFHFIFMFDLHKLYVREARLLFLRQIKCRIALNLNEEIKLRENVVCESVVQYVTASFPHKCLCINKVCKNFWTAIWNFPANCFSIIWRKKLRLASLFNNKES